MEEKQNEIHPKSWLATFGKPIQEFTDEELQNVILGTYGTHLHRHNCDQEDICAS